MNVTIIGAGNMGCGIGTRNEIKLVMMSSS